MNDKERGEVMIAHHEGKRIELETSSGDWLPAPTPNWNWELFNYRVEPEKPEPLELWVNVKGSDPLDRVHYTTKEAAMVNANDDVAIRTAVHMREVETVGALEAGVTHKIKSFTVYRNIAGPIVSIYSNKEVVEINDNEIPALITALQGLIEEES